MCVVWILGGGKPITGSETVGGWSSVVGIPMLSIYWQFPLGSECWKMQLGDEGKGVSFSV